MNLEQATGQTLRAMRKRMGMTQEQLALEAGAERNYISLIELGRNSPSLRMLFKLCAALGLTPSAFLSEVEDLLTAGRS